MNEIIHYLVDYLKSCYGQKDFIEIFDGYWVTKRGTKAGDV